MLSFVHCMTCMLFDLWTFGACVLRRLVFHCISEVLPTCGDFLVSFNNLDLLLVRRRVFWDCHCLLVGKMYGLVDDHNDYDIPSATETYPKKGFNMHVFLYVKNACFFLACFFFACQKCMLFFSWHLCLIHSGNFDSIVLCHVARAGKWKRQRKRERKRERDILFKKHEREIYICIYIYLYICI